MSNLIYKFIYNGCTYQGAILDVEGIPTALTDTENDKKLTAIYNEFENISMEKAADILESAIFAHCKLETAKIDVFVKINGINHTRYIGFDINSGKCYDFDPLNAGGYRPAVTAEELQTAEQAARNYYNICHKCVIEAPFSVSYVSANEVKTAENAAYEKLDRQLDGLED